MIGQLTSFLLCLLAGGADASMPVSIDAQSHVAVLKSGDLQFRVSLCCPQVGLNPESGLFGGDQPTRIVAASDREGDWTCEYAPVPLPTGGTLERTMR